MREKLTRRRIDRLENLAIVLLSCLAIFLLLWILTMQHIHSPWESGQSGGSFSGTQTASANDFHPAAMMVGTEQGRYGVQYDQRSVENLYRNGFGQLLADAAAASELPEKVSEEQWQTAVKSGGQWIWYDFLYDVPYPGWEFPDGNGVRGFLLAGEERKADALYLYCDTTGFWYRCGLPEEAELTFPALPEGSNGAYFAFEGEGTPCEALSPTEMLLSRYRDLTVWSVSAPLTALDANSRRDLLTELSFHPSAVSLYQTADGTVIREGADNLRLEKNGTLVFHGSLGGEVRYQAASDTAAELVEKSTEILRTVLPEQDERVRMVCRRVLPKENGETELTFCCLLDGAEVRLDGGVPAARFLFHGSTLTGFTIRAFAYTPTEKLCPVLPMEQTAAMLDGMERTGGVLRLFYQEREAGTVTAGWVLRTAAETDTE